MKKHGWWSAFIGACLSILGSCVPPPQAVTTVYVEGDLVVVRLLIVEPHRVVWIVVEPDGSAHALPMPPPAEAKR